MAHGAFRRRTPCSSTIAAGAGDAAAATGEVENGGAPVLSIARSFRPDEWRIALEEAGVGADQVRIVRRFPFRLCVERLWEA